MTPSINPPTDNIYKFSCLFGLALLISAVFSFISIYSTSLDRKIKFSGIVAALESKNQRSKAEDSELSMNKQLIEVTNSNEKFANSVIGAIVGVGLLLSGYGAINWHTKIQARDDLQSLLMLEKLRAEINKLKLEAQLLERQKRSEESA